MEEILFILNGNKKNTKYVRNSDDELAITKSLFKIKDKLRMIELIELNIAKIKDYYEGKLNNYQCDLIESKREVSKESLGEFLNNEYLLEIIDEFKEKIAIVKRTPLKDIERELEYKYNKLFNYLSEINEDNLLYLLKKRIVFEEYYYLLEKYYNLLRENLIKEKEGIKID